LDGRKLVDKVMKRKLLVLLKSKGVENTLIQELTGYHPKSINSLYKKWKDRDTYLDAERSGRPPKLDDDQTKELATILDDSRESSAASVKAEWGKTCPLPWSTRSIQRFRRKLGYRMKLAKQKPVLSEANKLKRLEYARKHHKAKWGRHIFIDESDFHLYPRKKFFWLRRRERKIFSSTCSFSGSQSHLWYLNSWTSFSQNVLWNYQLGQV